jgi:1-acyl-sn-glycerol-3-phosphate acyltransferase
MCHELGRVMTAAVWTPTSNCGAHCLRGDQAPLVGRAVRTARLAALLAVMLGAAALIAVLPLLPRGARAAALRRFARAVLRVLGIRLTVRGRLPGERALVVSNHVSWLDIIVILAAGRSRLVAKSEVRDWPVVGRLAAGTGAFFLDRSRPKALLSTVDSVRAALAAGDVVTVFPEGTTSCGEGAGTFRPAFFQAVVDSGASVVPLTLSFRAAGEPTTRPAFIGDDTLLESMRRVLALRGLTIRLSFGAVIHPGPAASRRTLARIAARAVGLPARTVAPVATTIPFPAPAPVVPGSLADAA